MENRFKLRISRMFRSSFGSCRTRKISDLIEKPVFTPQAHKNAPLFNPSPSASPPKARPFPSICKPKRHESTKSAINRDCVMIAPTETIPRREVFDRYPPFVVSGSALGKFPTGNNPLSPLNLFSGCKDFWFYEKKKSMARHRTKKKNNRVHLRSKKTSTSATFFSSSSQASANNYYSNRSSGWWWLSSEDETETLFSSRNLSSDSSESFTGRHHRRCSNRKRYDNALRRRAKNRSRDMGFLPLEGVDNDDDNKSKVKDSFAVVKRSSDPYHDFRTSMVEMIVERQMFGAEDLEQLLHCFISLNSHHHHRIIIEVFTQIWETLFSNCS
ncbi:transcription repressor OFP8-like [Hibiscus syriacus]|uniref:transcription repressor OFP8-like n=1 Tax=Hibiscus syriacus TaxID=106335 RepID=UPI0019217C9D|nr:transcription repressor OFP8-like [Hibiscus syriacus]